MLKLPWYMNVLLYVVTYLLKILSKETDKHGLDIMLMFVPQDMKEDGKEKEEKNLCQ